MDLTLRISQSDRRLRIVGVTYAQLLIAVSGVFFLLAGAYAALLALPNVTAALLGVGTSLLATWIASYVLNIQEYLRQGPIDYGLVGVWADRKGRQPADQQPINWVAEVRKTEDRCVLLGVSLSGFSIDDREDFKNVVTALTSRVKFDILLLDPNSGVAALRAEEEKLLGEDTDGRIRRSIKAFWEIRESLPADRRGNLRLFVYGEVPTFSLVWIDRFMIVTHYLPATRNANSPAYALWDMKPFKPAEKMLYSIFARNVDAVMRSSRTREINAQNLGEYVPRAGQP